MNWLKEKDFAVHNEVGNSPLYHSVMHNNLETAEFILDLGVDIHQRNEHGNTALHKAMMIGNFYMIKMLVERGASVQILNDYDQTPIYFASNSMLL